MDMQETASSCEKALPFVIDFLERIGYAGPPGSSPSIIEIKLLLDGPKYGTLMPCIEVGKDHSLYLTPTTMQQRRRGGKLAAAGSPKAGKTITGWILSGLFLDEQEPPKVVDLGNYPSLQQALMGLCLGELKVRMGSALDAMKREAEQKGVQNVQ